MALLNEFSIKYMYNLTRRTLIIFSIYNSMNFRLYDVPRTTLLLTNGLCFPRIICELCHFARSSSILKIVFKMLPSNFCPLEVFIPVMDIVYHLLYPCLAWNKLFMYFIDTCRQFKAKLALVFLRLQKTSIHIILIQ